MNHQTERRANDHQLPEVKVTERHVGPEIKVVCAEAADGAERGGSRLANAPGLVTMRQKCLLPVAIGTA